MFPFDWEFSLQVYCILTNIKQFIIFVEISFLQIIVPENALCFLYIGLE